MSVSQGEFPIPGRSTSTGGHTYPKLVRSTKKPCLSLNPNCPQRLSRCPVCHNLGTAAGCSRSGRRAQQAPTAPEMGETGQPIKLRHDETTRDSPVDGVSQAENSRNLAEDRSRVADQSQDESNGKSRREEDPKQAARPGSDRLTEKAGMTRDRRRAIEESRRAAAAARRQSEYRRNKTPHLWYRALGSRLLDQDAAIMTAREHPGVAVLGVASLLAVLVLLCRCRRSRRRLVGRSKRDFNRWDPRAGKEPSWTSTALPPTVKRACQRGNREAVLQWLNSAGDPNARDSDTRTALHHAVASGYPDLARTLLVNIACFAFAHRFPQENGATPDVLDINGRTPLHSAAHAGSAS